MMRLFTLIQKRILLVRYSASIKLAFLSYCRFLFESYTAHAGQVLCFKIYTAQQFLLQRQATFLVLICSYMSPFNLAKIKIAFTVTPNKKL